MKLQLTKKVKVEKIENDLSELFVQLPKSKAEISIDTLVRDVDAMIMNDTPNLDPGGVASIKKAFGNEGLADPAHKVKLHDGSYCNVAELVDKHKSMSEEIDKIKKDAMESETEVDVEKEGVDVEGDDKAKDNAEGEDMSSGDSMSDVEGGEDKQNEEDEGDKKSKLKAADKDKEIDAAKTKNELDDKRKRDKEKADRLRNANLRADEPVAIVDLPEDKVARGRARYGS